MKTRPLQVAGFLLALIAACLGFTGLAAQTVDLPSPTPGAQVVRPEVVLSWSYGEANLLPNGGFEAGTNGWEAGTAQVADRVSGTLPAEGTKLLSGRQATTVSREVQLPEAVGALSLSYRALSLQSQSSVTVDVLDGTRPRKVLSAAAHVAGGWRSFSVDLSAWAGKTVRLAWFFEFTDNVPWALDDVRLTMVPSDTEFVVWLAPGSNAPLERVGWTRSAGFPLRNLAPDRDYRWRVDLYRNGQVIEGPVWRFRTAVRMALSQVRIDPLPDSLCFKDPFPLGLQVTDVYGFGGGAMEVVPEVQAFGQGVPPPRVAITEINFQTEQVEFQNLGDETVDLSQWRVGLLHPEDTQNPRILVEVPAGSQLAPGGQFQVQLNSSAPSVWPTLRNRTQALWRLRGTAGVIIRDAAGNVVDCFFHQVTPSGTPRQTSSVAWADWQGQPVIGPIATGKTLQRFGDQDRNGATDWHVATASMGQLNSGLAAVLLKGQGSVPVTFPSGSLLTDTNSRVSVPVQFSGSASNVVLKAVLRRNNTRYEGTSAPFDLSQVCLALSVSPSLMESAGTVAGALKVSLSEPLPSDTVIDLEAPGSLLAGVTLPASLLIPAGARDAVGSISLTDDSLLNGPRALSLTARGPGWPAAQATLVVEDDEVATLSVEFPASVPEGGDVSGLLKVNPPPDRRVEVNLVSSDPARLVLRGSDGRPGRAAVGPGTREVAIHLVGLQNAWLEGAVNVQAQATLGNWIPGEAAVVVTDDETNTLSVELLDFGSLGEGGPPERVRVSLGGLVKQEVPVTLSFVPPLRVQNPGPVVIPAGQSNLVLMLAPLDDDQTNGSVQITVTANAPGWMDGIGTFWFWDNDPAQFVVRVPPGPIAPDEFFTLQLAAQTIDGFNLGESATFGGVYSAVDEQGLPVPILVDESRRVRVTEFRRSVRIRYEGLGAVGVSGPIILWNTPAPRDLSAVAYDRVRDRLLLASFGNGLYRVNPATGAREVLEPAIPNVMRLAVEGDYLFVQPREERRLIRVNLATWTVDTSWEPAGTSGWTGAEVLSFLPLEISPGSVLVALRMTPVGQQPMEVEFVVYDGSQPRPQRLSRSLEGNATLLPGRRPGEVLVSSAASLKRLWITPFGVEEDPGTEPILIREALQGVVMDPRQLLEGHALLRTGHLLPRWMASILGSMAVAADPTNGRIAWHWADPRAGDLFRILEPLTLREVWQAEDGLLVENLSPEMVWAGPHRWARIGGGRLNLHLDQAPDPVPGPDLSLSAAVDVRSPETARARVRFRIENMGTVPMTSVRLTLGLSPGATPQDFGPLLLRFPEDWTPSTNVLGGIHYVLGNLAPGEVVEVVPEFQAFSGGQLLLAALVGGDSADPNPENNRVVVSESGLAPSLRLGLVRLAPGADTALLTVPAIPGWYYRVERASSPGGPWDEYSFLMATGPSLEIPILFDGGDTGYWRVKPWP